MTTHTSAARDALTAQLDAIEEEEAHLRGRLADLGRQRAEIGKALQTLGPTPRGPSPLKGRKRGQRSRCWQEARELLRMMRGRGDLAEPFTLNELVGRLESTGWRTNATRPHTRSTLGKALKAEFGDALQHTGPKGPGRRFSVPRPLKAVV